MTNFIRTAWLALKEVLARWTYRKRIWTTDVEDLPETLDPRALYLIGLPNPWSVALLCPCGCSETIHLSLLSGDSPSWTLRLEGRFKLPTISPSIWRTKGCRAHFVLRQGEIVWFKSSIEYPE